MSYLVILRRHNTIFRASPTRCVVVVSFMTSMVNLSRQTSRQLAEEFVSTYVRSLDGFQAAYSESVVSRLRGSNVEITHD
ncbi:MAG: hypothetical protein ACI9DC_005163 [Gammaproteobacteria bacterium]|jgi:hypothetical protein